MALVEKREERIGGGGGTRGEEPTGKFGCDGGGDREREDEGGKGEDTAGCRDNNVSNGKGSDNDDDDGKLRDGIANNVTAERATRDRSREEEEHNAKVM